MVAAIKWETTSSATAVIDLGTTLNDATFSALGSEYDNSTNLNTYGWLELQTSTGDLMASAVTAANAYIDVFMVQAPDGTNYSNTPDVLNEFQDLRVATFAIPTEAAVVPLIVGPIVLPPHKIKFLVYNATGQQMNNTWELNLYTNNFESQ